MGSHGSAGTTGRSNGGDTLQSELRSIIAVVSEWPPELQSAALLDEVCALQAALKNARRALESLRSPTGQYAVWGAFAGKLADHLQLSKSTEDTREQAALKGAAERREPAGILE